MVRCDLQCAAFRDKDNVKPAKPLMWSGLYIRCSMTQYQENIFAQTEWIYIMKCVCVCVCVCGSRATRESVEMIICVSNDQIMSIPQPFLPIIDGSEQWGVRSTYQLWLSPPDTWANTPVHSHIMLPHRRRVRARRPPGPKPHDCNEEEGGQKNPQPLTKVPSSSGGHTREPTFV